MPDPTPQYPPPVMDYASPGTVPPSKGFGRGIFGWVLFIGLAVMLFFVLDSKHKNYSDISLSEFYSQVNLNNVSVAIIDNETVRGKFVKPVNTSSQVGIVAYRIDLPQGTAQSWAFMQWLLPHAEVRVENNQNVLVNLLLPLVPWLLIFGFIWFFVFRQLRKGAARQALPPKPIPVYLTTPENK